MHITACCEQAMVEKMDGRPQMHHANSIMSSPPLSAALRRIVCHAASASVAGEPLSRRTPPYLGSAASAPQEQQRH